MQQTTNLFAVSGFFSGFARVLDIGSTYDIYNLSASPHEADARALSSDWQQVGIDISNSIEEYGNGSE